MKRVEVSVDLASEEVQFLSELAERKRCTLAEMVEEAVAVYVGWQRERLKHSAVG
jgi:predicted transcriptional regulator